MFTILSTYVCNTEIIIFLCVKYFISYLFVRIMDIKESGSMSMEIVSQMNQVKDPSGIIGVTRLMTSSSIA